MLRFGFYNKLTSKNMMEDLITYCDNYKSFGKNTSFIAFEEPAPYKVSKFIEKNSDLCLKICEILTTENDLSIYKKYVQSSMGVLLS
ncbi:MULTISPECIES: hypothetical protein [unclassified Bartonella]|uniref:hypothetical protein n=1 Tax=unclassified Bartonella TaxID=2645622 RepID=UPI0035CEB3CC